MNTMFILLVEISGMAIMIIFVIAMLLLFLWSTFKSHDSNFDEIYEEQENEREKVNCLSFILTNNTDEELTVDLCNLDSNDNRYSFNVSNRDYKKTIEYLKSHTLFVYHTRVIYTSSDFYKNVIVMNKFTPSRISKKPLLVAFDEMDKFQFQMDTIAVNKSYNFDYFNSLELKLIPKSTITIHLYSSDYNKLIEKEPIKCALSIKNNSDEVKLVNLFDLEYYKLLKEKNDNEIEIKSLFDYMSDGDHYTEIILQNNSIPLLIKKLKFYLTADNSISKFYINKNERNIHDLINKDQYVAGIIDLELDNITAINDMQIEVRPNTEILISFK